MSSSKISTSRLFFYNNDEAGLRAYEMEVDGKAKFCFQTAGKELVQVEPESVAALLEALSRYVGIGR